MPTIAVLGPLAVEGDANALAPRERVVLAVLVVRRNEVVSAEVLADVLWGERPPASSLKMLQNCVVKLRKLLGARAVETRQRGYCLVLPADEIDAQRFDRLAARAQELLTLGEPDRAAYLAREALRLWQGPPLTDLEDWEPGRVEARRLDGLRLDVEELMLDAGLRVGRYRTVLSEAQARVAEAPLRERRWGLLATAQYQAGQQSDALRTLRRARQMLADELGLDPGPDLVTLEQAILRQDPSLVATAAPRRPSDICPYLGLVPYDIADADTFFGRDAEVSECRRRLADTGVLAVVGPSGSGKSSLVRAGVAAGLERDGQQVVIVTPGAHPLDALTALPRTGPAPVLVVDQCEEAVTVCTDGAERSEFFAALASHAQQARLVVALRADRLGDMSAHPAFARLLERGLYLLKAMDEEDLRAAVEGPARQAGLVLEPGLVDLLVRDTEGEPGALPLLSHALGQTWKHREGGTLTVAGYRATGGIRGAVARSAEQLYEGSSPGQRSILRDLLLRLVAPSPEGEPVRSRVPRRVIAADPERERLIEQLVRARLVTSDRDSVELAHEALARAWPRLRGWLDEDVDGQRIWRHLAAAADSWESMGRPDSELYRGVRLARAVDWHDRSGPDLNPAEHAFLHTSRRAADMERGVARRRRRVLVSALAATLAVTTTLAAAAAVSAQRAESEAERADQAAQLARARELAASATATISTDPALAKLLAVAAADLIEPDLDTLAVLHRTYAEDRVIDRYRWPSGHQFGHLTADLHPDGARLVASGSQEGQSNRLEVYDFDRGDVAWSWTADDPAVTVADAFFTSDGAHVVAGLVWQPEPGSQRAPPPDQLGAAVWDARTGELQHRVDLGRCGGLVITMTGEHVLGWRTDQPDCFTDGARTLALSGSLSLDLVDVDSGQARRVGLPTHPPVVSGDGSLVAFTDVSTGTPVALVVDLASGESVLEYDPAERSADVPYHPTALNHDGTLLAAGERPLAVWDVAAGEVISTFTGHGGLGRAYAFAPDGNSVYSNAQDGVVRRWDARTGTELDTHPAVGVGPVSVAESGRLLVVDGVGGQATLLEPGPRAELWAVPTCDVLLYAFTLGIGGDHAAVSALCPDRWTRTFVVDLDRRELSYALPGHEGQALVVSPDGTRFVRQEAADRAGEVTQGWVGAPAVWDLAAGDKLVGLDGICAYQSPTTDPTGQPGCARFPERPFPMWIRTWAWSPDSSLVAASDGTVIAVWDTGSGQMVHAAAPCPTFDSAFTPDGNELLVSCWGEGGRLVVLSTSTWQQTRAAALPVEDAFSLRFAGFNPGLDTVQLISGAGQGPPSMHWVDIDTLTVKRTLPRIHDGALGSRATSPDGSLLATGGSDGFVKVWDLDSGRQVHQIYVGDTRVQGVAFINDRHLAVSPQQGGIYAYTMDPDELLDIVRSSLTRGLTTTECERFNFGDHCPTLAELRGQAGRQQADR